MNILNNSDYIVLENFDIDFPRFSTMQRRLEEYEGFAWELYSKTCREFGVYCFPKLEFRYFALNPLANSMYAGVCVSEISKLNGQKILRELMIGVSFTHSRIYDDRIYDEVIPHEVCHALHAVLDLESLTPENYHGEFFFELARYLKKTFRFVNNKINVKSAFEIEAVEEWENMKREIKDDVVKLALENYVR